MRLNYLKNINYHIINNIFIICFSLILLLISLNYNLIFILLFGYLFYLYKKDKYIFIISLIICVIVLIIFLLVKIYQTYLINNYHEYIIGKIIKITKKETYQKITVKYKIFKVIIKDYDFISLELGDKIKVYGTLNVIDTNHIPYGFNYEKYFYNNLYLYEIKSNNIILVSKNFSIYKINYYFNKYIEFFFKGNTCDVLKGFILGDTSSFDDTFASTLQSNGIIHLFAISGSHIVLILSVLEFIFKRRNNKNKIINIILFIYLLITRFSISITRAIVTYYINQIIKYKKLNYTSLDSASLVFIIFIIINPFLIYNLGFVLSFISTFLIILINSYLKTINSIKQMLFITLIINLFTFPIVINLNNEFNILSPFINVIMILLVEGILIPLSFIVFFIPILNIIYERIIISFIEINNFLYNLCCDLKLIVHIKEISIINIVIYYLLIILLIKTFFDKPKLKKVLISFIIFILFLVLNGSYTFYPTITFLDLYSGESTLIEYHNEIILIDTGEGINNEVTLFLKAKGIKKIDYLILTHNHSDHNGEAKNIINNFVVTHIVVSEYDNSEFSNYKNVIKLKKGMILKTDNIIFNCLFPITKSSNENNNSLVLYFNIKEINFLFCGDIEVEIENLFSKLNVDVLKVSHHGSSTSTTDYFLSQTNPKHSIIMSGRNNNFEFPSDDVIKRLKKNNTSIYLTKELKTIILKIKNKKCIFIS